MPAPTNIYGNALADLYGRGMDISMQNPWALAQVAFPQAQRVQPGISAEQLLSGAQQFLQPQPQAMQPPMMMEASADALSALDQVIPGMTAPDVPMSEDTSLGGRIAALGALNNSLSPASLTFDAMGMFAGPFGPIGAKAAKAAIKWHLNREISKEIDAILNEPTVGDLPTAGNRDVPSPTGDPTAPGAGAPPGIPDDGPVGIVSVGEMTVTDPVTGQVTSVPGSLSSPATGPDGGTAAGAAAAAAAGEGGNTGVGTGEGPAGESGGPGGPGVYKRGGMVKGKSKKAPQHGAKFHPGFDRAKGSKIVPIKAHEGEFVVNQAATKAARPELEALNALIPPESLDALIGKANKFFGG